MIRKSEDEDEVNIGRWMPTPPDGKLPTYSPVYERHMVSYDVFLVAGNDFDFEFEGSPDDVGMQTGATIHTMNGLKMRPRKIDANEPLAETGGWWERQHLKRGLTASGRPYQSKEEVQSQKRPKRQTPDDPGISMSH